MANRHYYATSDQEEELALKLALEASLADAGNTAAARGTSGSSQQQPPARSNNSHPAGPAPYSSSGNGAKMAAETGSQCGGCSKWLGLAPGYTVRALGQQWHPECFRCAGCQQPLTLNGGANTFAVGHDQQPYHEACHKQLFHPVCSVCKQYIPEGPSGQTEWREHPFWRLKQCPSHYADGSVSCCSCGRLQPLADEWASLQDGRHLCLECLDTLVVDTKDAQPLYDEILRFFAHMGMPHPYKAPLLLVEGPVLDEYAHKEGRRQDAAHAPMFSVRGLCVAHVYTTIPSVVRAVGQGLGFGAAPVSSIATRMAPLQQHCSVSALLVMYGLPRLLLGSIVAHELMHAYLRMRHVTGLPLQVEEGLCQLVAMLWLDSQDFWAKQQQGGYQERLLSYLGYQIRTDTSEVYGDGFRIAMEKFQMRGLKALVEHVIAHGQWPNWSA
ncbi:hypothetical protein OEZ85_003595 [Tetradesmus obliquus]|uniref:LIM zinc-binding domain-containing protein n=1 Tax=Tetradesmus obliquus TaxID=3088 RepID=A0ABY8UBT0_TETOB|nr:hypothetical protein OEZ85_003595 [Tetradesmus obliquus]